MREYQVGDIIEIRDDGRSHYRGMIVELLGKGREAVVAVTDVFKRGVPQYIISDNTALSAQFAEISGSSVEPEFYTEPYLRPFAGITDVKFIQCLNSWKRGIRVE